MAKEWLVTRKYPRITVGGEASGQIAAVYEASLLNISLGGVLIEHAHIVRPGTDSSLLLNVHGRAINLRCRVIRSAVHRLEIQPDGQGDVIYHTGLEFQESSDEARQLIRDYFQSMIRNSRDAHRPH